MKSIEYKGVWWTKEHPDKVRGTLTFSGKDRARLDLDDAFLAEEIKIVRGVTDTGKRITLIECVKTRWLWPPISHTGLVPETYRVSEVYIGAHFDAVSEIRFQKMYVCFSYLSQWVNVSGLKNEEIPDEQKRGQGYKISYTRPEPRSVLLPDSSQLSIVFGCNMNSSRDVVTLKQTEGIHIITPGTLALNEWLIRYVLPLQDLLGFATLRPNSITELWAEIESFEEEQHRNTRVDIFFSPIFHDEGEPVTLIPDDFLFRFEDVDEHLQDVIANWFKSRDDLSIVFHVFFGAYYQANIFLDTKFINIVQAAEVYHRRRYQEDITLQKRIRELLDETDDVISELIDNKDEFAKKVADTRNYFIHYGERLQDSAAIRAELYFLTEVLGIMMRRCFLKEVGIPSEKCSQMLQRNRWYKHVQENVYQFSWGLADISEEGAVTE